MKLKPLLALVLIIVTGGVAWAALSPFIDIRCCFTVVRNPDGSILRSSKVRTEFKKLYPCPSFNSITGYCEWIMDHPIPLACGGVDAVYNLQWLPISMWKEKSKWERKVYGGRLASSGCP